MGSILGPLIFGNSHLYPYTHVRTVQRPWGSVACCLCQSINAARALMSIRIPYLLSCPLQICYFAGNHYPEKSNRTCESVAVDQCAVKFYVCCCVSTSIWIPCLFLSANMHQILCVLWWLDADLTFSFCQVDQYSSKCRTGECGPTPTQKQYSNRKFGRIPRLKPSPGPLQKFELLAPVL